MSRLRHALSLFRLTWLYAPRMDHLYDELRHLAHGLMAQEGAAVTLQPTALVHEAWLRLGRATGEPGDRARFFADAAQAMRRILIEEARRRQRLKRGGDRQRVTFVDVAQGEIARDVHLLRLDAALGRLEKGLPELGRLVHLRYFAGMTIPETAKALERSEASVKRDWTFARAWLRDCMKRIEEAE